MNGNVNITVYNNKSTQEAAERAELAASKVQDVTVLNLKNEIPSPSNNVLPTQRPNGSPLETGDIVEVIKGTYKNIDGSLLKIEKDRAKLYFKDIIWILSLEWDFGIPEVIDGFDSESGTSALSAKRGKELNEKIEAIPTINIIDGFNSQDVNSASSANSVNILNEIKIDKNKIGVPNGIASLDTNGKIPSSQIGLASLFYKGLWDANVNSPTITNNSGNQGEYYLISKSGSQDLGNGIETYSKMGYVIYSNGIWEYNDVIENLAPAEFEDFFGI